MGRQAEPQGTFTRPYTCTHTFTRLGAVSVQMEGGCVVCDKLEEELSGLFLCGGGLCVREPLVDDGGVGEQWLPWGRGRQNQLVAVVDIHVNRFGELVEAYCCGTARRSLEMLVLWQAAANAELQRRLAHCCYAVPQQ